MTAKNLYMKIGREYISLLEKPRKRAEREEEWDLAGLFRWQIHRIRDGLQYVVRAFYDPETGTIPPDKMERIRGYFLLWHPDDEIVTLINEATEKKEAAQ